VTRVATTRRHVTGVEKDLGEVWAWGTGAGERAEPSGRAERVEQKYPGGRRRKKSSRPRPYQPTDQPLSGS
jgi:hypothetical protein